MLKRMLKLYISDELTGSTVKQVLYGYYKMSSRLITKLKCNHGIIVNGSEQLVNTVVHKGDILEIVLPSEQSDSIVPTAMLVNIIFEDEDIIVVDKPSGIPVHPCQGHYSDTLANGVVYHWRQKGEQFVFRPVHRLDKDTSGLILIAKNQYAHQQLSNQITQKYLRRKYLAIVHGMIKRQEGTIDLPIARKPGSIIERIISPGGQQAVTHYKTVDQTDKYTLLELMLETGRTHQIRVHMSYLGHPLVGDWLYGKGNDDFMGRQALHSYYLEFVHPVTGNNIKLECDLPQDMQRLMQ